MAHVRAVAERQAVYNLTVEGEHVYFANGVLVSNCNAAEYLSWGVEYMEPDAKLRDQVKPERAAYLKLLTTIPVEGYEEENSLAEDIHDMLDDEQDLMIDEADRMFRRMPGDDEEDDDDES